MRSGKKKGDCMCVYRFGKGVVSCLFGDISWHSNGLPFLCFQIYALFSTIFRLGRQYRNITIDGKSSSPCAHMC